MGKTAEIKCMVEPDIKIKLQEKARELGLTLTGLIEKIAREPIVFMDQNVKRLVDGMGKLFPRKI
jgi:hypothetical protein